MDFDGGIIIRRKGFGLVFAIAIFVSLFLCSCAYASNPADNFTALDDGNHILQSSGNEGFSSIQALIDSALDGDAIELTGISYLGNGSAITVERNITILGNGAVLDAQGKSGIFKVSNASVNLINITLINADSKGYGSAIQNYGVLNLSGCKFSSNHAENGVIYNNNILKIQDSSFDSNSAFSGGALFNQGFAEISDSKFTSNTASNGAAICSFSNLVISGCEFESNIVSHSHGVIFIENGNANISGSIFRSNSGSDEGCCIFSTKKGNVSVVNSGFIQNSAYSYAGAIDNGGDMVISSCSFEGNSAWGAGAIDNAGNLIVIDSNFTQNKVTRNGGAIDTKGELKAVNCIFLDNSAGEEGGAIIARGDINVTMSSFIGNTASIADAIYINNVTYSIADNWWDSNSPDFSRLLNIDVDDDFTWITHSSKLNACDVVMDSGDVGELVSCLSDDRDNPIRDALLSVALNGNEYSLKTDDNGEARLKIDLKPGNYTAVITYEGNDRIFSSMCESKITVKSRSDNSDNQSNEKQQDNPSEKPSPKEAYSISQFNTGSYPASNHPQASQYHQSNSVSQGRISHITFEGSGKFYSYVLNITFLNETDNLQLLNYTLYFNIFSFSFVIQGDGTFEDIKLNLSIGGRDYILDINPFELFVKN